jgi:hypothetical protein
MCLAWRTQINFAWYDIDPADPKAFDLAQASWGSVVVDSTLITTIDTQTLSDA